MSKLESRDLAIFHALDNWTPRERVSAHASEQHFSFLATRAPLNGVDLQKCKFELFEVFTVGTEVGEENVGHGRYSYDRLKRCLERRMS